MGTIAIAKTMMPMPPSHWVRARQSSRERGASSMCSITVDPVVVKPDTASKSASAGVSTSVRR
jgi:hypothetical protein